MKGGISTHGFTVSKPFLLSKQPETCQAKSAGEQEMPIHMMTNIVHELLIFRVIFFI